MAIQLPNGRNYFEATGGGPGVGYRLYTYIPGTSTPKATYTTSVGNVPNTNPVVMDARGEAAIYWDGTYDVSLYTAADVLVWGPERLEDAAGNLRDDLASTASASNGAGLSGHGYANAYAAATVGYRLNANEVYVGTNTAADASNLAAAVARNVGGSLAVVGTVQLTTSVALASGSVYDLRKANIINKNAVDGLCLTCTGVNGVTIIGGDFSPDASIVTATHPTGTYGSGSAVQVLNSTNCHLVRANISNFYGAVNFYNSSNCSASHNFLTDNAGGIQALADNTLAGSSTVKGLDFSHNSILNSGDDGLSFLIGAGHTGTISGSRIAFNHVTKDVGTHGTVGQARGIALVGEPTSGANNVFGVVVIGNTGYYMGSEFIRATGVIRSTIAHNFVDGFSANGAVAAYTFGDLTSGAYGIQDCVLEDNRAINNLTNSQAFVINGALRCKITNNFAESTIAGEGAMGLLNSTFNILRDNTMHNASAFGIKLFATSTDNDLYGNDVSVAVAGISDLGARNYKENNIGWVTRAVNQAAVTNPATTVVVNHGINVISATRLRVNIVSLDGGVAATTWWVSTFTSTQFTINVNVNPTAQVFFQWEAYESRA